MDTKLLVIRACSLQLASQGSFSPMRLLSALLLVMPLLGCSRSPCKEHLDKHVNGRLKRAGKICNGLRQGRWFEDYAEGALRWQGTYVNDTLDMHPPIDSSEIHVAFLTGDLRAGQEAQVRVQVSDIHPSFFTIDVENGTIVPPGDPDMYDEAIRPAAPGTLVMRFAWTDPKTGVHQVLGERHFPVKP